MRTYGKLRELIRLKFGTIQKFAEKLGMKHSTLTRKLLGRNEWKSSEIERIVELLEIDTDDIREYFFY